MDALKTLSVGTIVEWLRGKKTYILAVVIMIDELGAAKGLWAPNHVREVIEFALAGTALRAAVK